MTKPHLIVPTLFAALALAAIAAGCSGSNGGGSLPASPGPGDAARHKRHVGAVLRIHIPPKTKHRKRDPHYVSTNTRSITVGVQYVTASPWPALATQTLVADAAHCRNLDDGGGRNCSFTVQAYVGKNIFTFNEYASQTPSPQDTPLGTLTSPVTKISPGDPSLSFTLEGVVNSVLVAVPNPESTQNAASEVTQPVPIGSPSSFPLYVVPEDASGAYIVTDTFSSPITVKVSPANSGVSLSLNKQCAGDASGPTSVTLTCAADLNNVTVKYDGTVTQTGVNAYVDNATITATPQFASPAPHAASVALTSNLLPYQIIPAPPFTLYIDASNLALDPVSGKIAFAYTFGNENPTLVEFDPANPTAAPVTQAMGYNASFLIFDAAGHLWTNDATSPALHCYSSIGATPVTVGVSDATSGLDSPVIAPDASGNIWYSGYDSNAYPAIGYFAGSCASASHIAQFIIPSANEYPAGLAPALPVGGTAGVGMLAGGSPNNFYTVNTATPPSAPPSPVPWPSGLSPVGLVNDKAYNIYDASSASLGFTPVVNRIAAGTANIQDFVDLPPDAYPYGMDAYSGTQSAAQALAVLDGSYEATALVNPAAAMTEPLEIGSNDAYECFGIAYDKNGGVWTLCDASDNSMWVYHPVVTSNWGIVPTTFAFGSESYQDVVTIAEKSGVNNSPFTVTNNSNPGVIAVSTPWPAPGAQVRRTHVTVVTPSFPHAIPVTIGELGTSVITVTDKNGRTQSATVQVNQVSSPGIRRRHDRRRLTGPRKRNVYKL